MAVLIASDLHLSEDRPEQLRLFSAVLDAAALDALYLLGDIVEFWLGDDDDSPVHREVVRALARVTAGGTALFVTPGNRDFLLGRRFCEETGAALLPDYHVADLYGERVLLTHGDLLCTKDLKYQAFRKFVRDPAKQAEFLRQPLAARRKIAADTRSGTTASMLEKDHFIMDVDEDEVRQVLRSHGVGLLVHGHTHRPAVHEFVLDGLPRRRIVLGDWYDEGRILLCEPEGMRLVPVPDFIAARGRP